MSVSKEQFEALFNIGDLIPCANQSFSLAGISREQIVLRSSDSETSEVNLDWQSLSVVLDTLLTGIEDKAGAPLTCLASEYLKRAEEAARDAEVDKMWLSAMSCQL